MKKFKKFDFSLFLSVMLLISTTFMSIGYAAINSITAEINGTATVNVQSGVFITDVEYFSDVDAHIAQCEINNIYGTLLDSKIYLSETNNASSVTYTITVYNRTDETYAFKGVVYDQSAYSNEDIKCEVSDINVNDTLGSNGTKTFKVTFSYRNGLSTNNILTSIVSFAFGVNHTITYNNITGSGYPANIADGLTYTNTFTDPPEDVVVKMGGTTLVKETDYTYSNGTLTIPNVSGDLEIEKAQNTSAMDNIVEEQEEIKGSSTIVDFSKVSTNGEGGMYSITDPNSSSGDLMYFFRGNVSDNYFSFAGTTWRILRINSDGTIRLITNTAPVSSRFNSSYRDGRATSLEVALNYIKWVDINDTTSTKITAQTALENWYNSNIGNNATYSSYVVQSQFLYDTSVEVHQASTGQCNYFGPYVRAGSDTGNYNPTLAIDNQYLINANVGLITSDEILYAGGAFNKNNTNYFLRGAATWTFSPSFHDSNNRIGMFALDTSGKLHDWPSNNTIYDSVGLRPVITVRGDIELTGDGSQSNPYQFAS